MNNRINKQKKSSKLKHTIIHDRYGYNSPAKFNTASTLSSGCCPKQPPNISNHYLQKKRHQIKGQYYIVQKQNKRAIMNNASNTRQQYSSILQTTDRLKQKRNTHNYITYETSHHKLLQAKKSNQQSYILAQQDNLKTSNKHKATRNPIPLGSLKTKHLKQSQKYDKQNKPYQRQNKLYQRQSKIYQKQINIYQKQPKQHEKQVRFQRKKLITYKSNKPRISYIPQNEQCHLKCFQNLSNHSIAQSKASTNYFAQISNHNLQESHIITDKNNSIQSKKRFHRSPKIMSPTAFIKIPEKTPQQQIAQFQSKIHQINLNFQHDSLAYMQKKDIQYVKTQNLNRYLANQIHLDWKKRATVIYWMIQVLTQIGGKRQTLANAVNIFDQYLTKTYNIPLDHIQCTAVACLLISAKLQDKSLSAQYLSEATLNKYSAQQIMQQQFKIFKTLSFIVNIPTLNNWSNRLATQWDLYLDNCQLNHFDIIVENINNIKFKNTDQISYYNFRWLCQYVDFSIMDICTLRYQPRMLSLAFIYLILVMRLKIYTKQQVIGVFPNSSQFLLQKSTFHDFFSMFLKDSFDQQLMDLLPMIQYCSAFVILPLQFKLPEAIPSQMNDMEDDKTNYEQFCAYQTKNQHYLAALYNRNRNIY